MTREKVGKTTSKGKTVRVSHKNYAIILRAKGKLLVTDKRDVKDREDFSDNDAVSYLFQNLKEGIIDES